MPVPALAPPHPRPALRASASQSAATSIEAVFFVGVEFLMIHADARRDDHDGHDGRRDARLDALQAWLARQLPGERLSLSPASEDASFRRYFRAALEDGRSFIAMDAPPEKEDCRPFVHVAGLLAQAGVHAPQVHAQDLAQGFLLLTDLGTKTYIQELN